MVQLLKFLKEQRSSQMGKGLYEALQWLNNFINYFELDYQSMLEENKEILDQQAEDKLSEEEIGFRKEHKQFMNSMFKEQFPDIVEIILIYA